MARKFGLEVEFTGNPTTALNRLRAAGLSTMHDIHGYSGFREGEWIIKRDASVNNGGELVGPPLDWDNPSERSQIATAMNCLVEAGCAAHVSAGVHVHVDASDLDPRQLVGVVRTFTKFEDQIYRIASSGWRTIRPGGLTGYNGGWCKPLPRATVEKLAKARTHEQLSTAWYGSGSSASFAGHGHDSRYHGLNMHSYFYRGTVEFRVFNSTMNPKRIEAYVTLCMAVVQDGRDNKLRSINKVFALGDMASGVLTEKKAFHHLCQFLRWENELSPISKEDLALISYCWKNSLPQTGRRSA